jgi:hypothetical protein
MRGPTKIASNSEPRAADPFQNHALTPCWYASPVAPTVAPAPMFAASIVAAMYGHVSLRPATKKSAGPRTLRAITGRAR